MCSETRDLLTCDMMIFGQVDLADSPGYSRGALQMKTYRLNQDTPLTPLAHVCTVMNSGTVFERGPK